MRVDANNRTAGRSGDSKSGTPCSTTDIEQDIPWSKVQPVEKPVLFFCGQPAILANVLTKRFTTNARVQLRLKVSVIGVVVTNQNWITGLAFHDFNSAHEL